MTAKIYSLGIVGRKAGMSRVFLEDGKSVPVTLIEATPNRITQIKTPDTDGYSAVQLGWTEKRAKVANKPEVGHAKKAGVAPQRTLLEFRDYAPEDDSVTVGVFEPGQKVDVTGTTKAAG